MGVGSHGSGARGSNPAHAAGAGVRRQSIRPAGRRNVPPLPSVVCRPAHVCLSVRPPAGAKALHACCACCAASGQPPPSPPPGCLCRAPPSVSGRQSGGWIACWRPPWATAAGAAWTTLTRLRRRCRSRRVRPGSAAAARRGPSGWSLIRGGGGALLSRPACRGLPSPAAPFPSSTNSVKFLRRWRPTPGRI